MHDEYESSMTLVIIIIIRVRLVYFFLKVNSTLRRDKLLDEFPFLSSIIHVNESMEMIILLLKCTLANQSRDGYAQMLIAKHFMHRI
jgi:hypothetical protein